MELKDVCMTPWEKGFKLPDKFNIVSLYLERHIENGRGSRIAFYHKDRQITYQEIYELTSRAGNAFSKLGIKKGDRVLMMMHDHPYWVAVHLGLIKIGAVPVSVNVLATAEDLTYFIEDSQASVLVVEEDLLPKIRQVTSPGTRVVVRGQPDKGMLSLAEIINAASPTLEMCQTNATDHCYWLYTSGTTGKPKGVVHLHKDLVYAIETYGKAIGFTPESICYGVPKLFYSFGLNMELQLPLYYGAAGTLVEERSTPEVVLQTLLKYRPTKFFSVPTAYAQFLHYLEVNGLNPDLSFLKVCTSGGEVLPAVIYRRWFDRFHIEILDGIGSSEVSFIYVINPSGKVKPGSCGKPLTGYQIKLVDDNWNEVPVGQVGDLWVKGETVTPGYWNKPEQNRECYRDGWMKTGDCLMMDEEGYLYHCGRSNDTMKVSGIWVAPSEVEVVLKEHEAVLECAVVGKADENDLIKPKAFVIIKNGYNPDEKLVKDLQDFVKSRIAPYKYPRWIEFLDELPTTATGKIQRYKLRERG